MRSLRLMGEEVIPAVREMGKELELNSPFETDPTTNQPFEVQVNEPVIPDKVDAKSPEPASAD
jgi:hypothetical protein